MRGAFIEALIADASQETMLLIGDLGYSVVEKFGEKFPGNLLNCGVAEQNMTGMAAGLALEGFKVFTYSIANFNTLRCLEQIRNDICYHNLDVTVVSVGAGFMYGSAGYSHHAVQDIGAMAAFPNMTLLLPGDPAEVKYCVEYALAHSGPKYLRIGKQASDAVERGNMAIGNCNLAVDRGSEFALLAVAGMLAEGGKVVEALSAKGVDIDLLSIPVLTPWNMEPIAAFLREYRSVFVLEDHVGTSGVGAILSTTLQEENVKIFSIALRPSSCDIVGDQDYLLGTQGLDGRSVEDKIAALLGKSKDSRLRAARKP
ncbi:MAG: transketolase [Spirochaetae bacterium HGW-Spirochaetae-9]|nr:MAG: transketolase [Spirochaetae bacterium HGW-Spirochaetae-9]